MQSHYRISRIQRGAFNGELVASFHANILQDDGTWRDCGRYTAPIRAARSTLWQFVYVRARIALDETSGAGIRIVRL